MASIGDLVVNLTARTSGFQKGMKQARGSMALTAISARSMIAALAPILAPLAVVAGFKRMVTAGLDFNRAMQSSTAIMGELTKVMRDDMRKAAFQVARDTKFAASEAAEAYFFLASAGLSASASLKAMPQVAQFAQAGNFGLALATDLLTDAQSALGLSSKNAAKNLANMARVSDVLAKANTLANASVQQFSESLTNKAAAALKVLGKDLEEGVAVLAAFADQGLKGAEAGTALNIVLRDLQTKAILNKKQFKAMGISVFDATGDMRNIADVIGDLENALGGLSDEQKKSTLLQLGFADKSISFINTILGSSDAIRKYEVALRAAGGTTKEIADKQLTAFDKGLNKLTGSLTQVGAGLASTFGPILGHAFERTADFINGVIFMFENFRDIASLALLNIVETGINMFPKMEEPMALMIASYIAQWAGANVFFRSVIDSMIGGLKELKNFGEAVAAGFSKAFEGILDKIITISGGLTDVASGNVLRIANGLAGIKAAKEDIESIGGGFSKGFDATLITQDDIVAPDAFKEFGKAFEKTQTDVLKKFQSAGGLSGFIEEERKRINARIGSRVSSKLPSDAFEDIIKGGGDGGGGSGGNLPDGGGPKFAGAATAGSTEAFSAILKATRGGKKPEENTAKNTKDTAKNTEKMAAEIVELKKLLSSGNVQIIGSLAGP